jgi:SAM-dependent methyltransferase/peptidoglycan/xylan/chitin deacetylase (PgdA/CDA1 family)
MATLLSEGVRTPVSEWSDLSDLGGALRLPRPVRLNAGRVVAEGIVRPVITQPDLLAHFTELTGVSVEAFRIPTRIFEYQLHGDDDVLVRDAESERPLIVRRDGEVVINFDIAATQAFDFADSARPIYTYIPWFNIQSVPSRIRRPVSNYVAGRNAPRGTDLVDKHRALPLTNFEFVVLLVHASVTVGSNGAARPFHWPSGKKAVFISFHDVDPPGFLRPGQRDTPFRGEAKHQIRSTWFIPTGFVGRHDGALDWLMKAGHEVGWHGHKHDHRDHVGRYAEQAADALRRSRLNKPANFPTGMRAPKLLKSHHLFEQIERSCRMLRYDTSFRNGMVPYPLWLRGRRSTILEIPTTVPTDIALYNEMAGIEGRDRLKLMLQAQIARTEKLLEIGGVISIVTHPEESLSERPDFLEMYDQYLSFIRSRSDIWFATTGELFKYWTGEAEASSRDWPSGADGSERHVHASSEYPGLSHQPDGGRPAGSLIRILRPILRAQFGKPSGFLGEIAGRIMARTKSNTERTRWTLSLLDLRPEDRVLEIGFGPGLAIEIASGMAPNGLVAGVDHSEVMVRHATKRNARAVRDGKVDLRLGSAGQLPAFEQPFDKIFSINSIHFWEDPIGSLRRMRQMLRPGGVLAITMQPRSRNATSDASRVIGEELVAKLERAGFSQCRLELRRIDPTVVACALGTNGAPASQTSPAQDGPLGE